MIYRDNFSIRDIYFNCFIPYATRFIPMMTEKGAPQLFKEWIIVYENTYIVCYIQVPIIEATVKWIKEKMIAEPDWADRAHRECEEINRQYFDRAEQIRGMNLSSLDNHALAHLYIDFHHLQMLSHTRAIATTWFVDSDGEDFSTYLREQLAAHITKQGEDDTSKIANAFVLLTTPTRSGMLQEEQQEFLRLVAKTKTMGKADEAKLKNHWQKWCWIPYGYTGPPYSLDYYCEQVTATIKSGIDPETMRHEEAQRLIEIKRKQDALITKLKLPDNLDHLFAMARDIIWLKDFRKLCFYHGCFVLDMITKEIAKRLHLTLKQASHFLDEEILPALTEGNVDETLLNERMHYSVARSTPEELTILTGDEARKFVANIQIEKIETDATAGLRGSCACPGQVKGIVKVINTVDEMTKMEQGDIMIAHTTFPALVPAMKKAAAIVTEDGGITCHAAIVAREWGTPCVVGVKKITEALKDGDMVEVDAIHGIIKKI